MKKVILIIFLFSHAASGQHGEYFMSARAMGMGLTGVLTRDAYAPFGNMAGAAGSGKTSFVFAFHNLFGVAGLNRIAAGATFPYRKGAFMAGVFRFGDHWFNEHKAGVGYSHKIRFVSLGIRINFLQYKADLLRTSGACVLEFGGLVELSPSLNLAAYIFNLNRSKTGEQSHHQVPVHLKAGISYIPVKTVTLLWEIRWMTAGPSTNSLGMEYDLRGKIFLRTGVSYDPEAFYLGLGIPIYKLTIDQALSIHPALGLSYQFSLAFNIL